MRHFISSGIALSALTLALFSAQTANAQVFSESFIPTVPTVPNTAAGSSTAYTLATGTTTSPGQYRVITNAATAFTNPYTSFFDHTVGTSAGAFLFFDGSATPLTTIFSTGPLALASSTQYSFSYWGASVFTSNFPTLQAFVNGVALGSSLTTTNGVWTQRTSTFTTTVAGNYTFTIANTNLSTAAGNDGGVDDITLTTVAPEPGSALLLVPGLLGLVGIARRRNRK